MSEFISTPTPGSASLSLVIDMPLTGDLRENARELKGLIALLPHVVNVRPVKLWEQGIQVTIHTDDVTGYDDDISG